MLVAIFLLRKLLRKHNLLKKKKEKKQSLKITLKPYCCSAHLSLPGDLNRDTSKNPEFISDKPWPDSSALYIHSLPLYCLQLTKNRCILEKHLLLCFL